MKTTAIRSVAAMAILYFAAVYFRYEPIPRFGNEDIYVWDRFRARVCVATRPEWSSLETFLGGDEAKKLAKEGSVLEEIADYIDHNNLTCTVAEIVRKNQ